MKKCKKDSYRQHEVLYEKRCQCGCNSIFSVCRMSKDSYTIDVSSFAFAINKAFSCELTKYIIQELNGVLMTIEEVESIFRSEDFT